MPKPLNYYIFVFYNQRIYVFRKNKFLLHTHIPTELQAIPIQWELEHCTAKTDADAVGGFCAAKVLTH